MFIKYTGKLGDDKWALMETTVKAMLEVGELDAAGLLILDLQAQFSNSTRVDTLHGLYYEASAQYDDAALIYSDILKKTPGNQFVAKRQITMLKEQGKIEDAIKALNAYLTTFTGDESAWGELAGLFLLIGDLKQAAFCYEGKIKLYIVIILLLKYFI